jgi:peptidoglycan/LPS O-acetylase OafA/YrhL
VDLTMTTTLESPPSRPRALARQPRRGDIQGLRAVAVLVVIGAHAGFSPLPGGFVGVDVFFVISGFLISRLLFLEASRTGTISLRNFYARRARRILPAATVVSLATLIGSVLWLSAREALDVVYDVAWATFFGANLRFADRGVDYFAQDLGPSPMQHYWSLSVEEQFYLGWPLILLACLVWTRRRQGRGRLPRIPLLAALVALSVASFAYATVLTQAAPVAAYFSTPARVWELGVGAILALVGPAIAQWTGSHLQSLLAATGLGLIAVSCIEFGQATPFPGSAALLPVLGSALVLLAGCHPSGSRGRVSAALSWAPLRTIGDWSYSLYLWHWPVLILAREAAGRDLSPGETALALVSILGLSAATYWWVETPFRERRARSPRRSLALYPLVVAVVATACVGAASLVTWQAAERGSTPAVTLADYPGAAGAPGPVAPVVPPEDPLLALVEASALAAQAGGPIPSDLTPDLLDLRDDVADVGACDYTEDVRTLCPRGQPDAERSVVVLGDSHARAWIPAFDEIGAQAGWATYYLVRPQCTASRVLTGLIPGGRPDEECVEFRDWALAAIKRLDPDLVVVATAPAMNGVYVDGERVIAEDAVAAAMSKGYADLFARLAELSPETVLIRDVPRSLTDTGECLAKRRADLGDCTLTLDPRSTLLADVSVAAADKAGVRVIDPTPWFCWQDICPPVIGSTIPLRDLQHITVTYSRSLAPTLGRALGPDFVARAAQ